MGFYECREVLGVRYNAVSTIASVCRIASDLNLKLIPVFADMNEFLQGYRVTDEWFREMHKEIYTKHYETVVGALSACPEIIFLWEIFNEPMTSQFGIIFDFASNVSEKIKQIDPLHAVSIGTMAGSETDLVTSSLDSVIRISRIYTQ